MDGCDALDGSSVSGVDVDGDGIEDLAIGDRTDTVGAGAVHIVGGAEIRRVLGL